MGSPMHKRTPAGEADQDTEETVRNGNPGRPQSEYEVDDPMPQDDPSEFAENSGDVVPGSAAPTRGDD